MSAHHDRATDRRAVAIPPTPSALRPPQPRCPVISCCVPEMAAVNPRLRDFYDLLTSRPVLSTGTAITALLLVSRRPVLLLAPVTRAFPPVAFCRVPVQALVVMVIYRPRGSNNKCLFKGACVPHSTPASKGCSSGGARSSCFVRRGENTPEPELTCCRAR